MFSEKFALPLLLSQQEWAVTHWRGVANFVGMMWLSQSSRGNRKIGQVKGPGPAPFKKTTGDMQYKCCKEFMECLTDPLTQKVAVSTVNRKLKELQRLQGIGTRVYHPDLLIHDSQRMSYASCGEDASLYTGFYCWQ